MLASTDRALPVLDHLIALSDDVGIAQHATYCVPNRAEGYCVDDVARAFMVALAAAREPKYAEVALPLAGTYLAFLHHAQRPDGRFRNFMSYERTWLEEIGSDDSNGRAIWALGYGVSHAPKARWRTLCARMLDRALGGVASFRFPRSCAFAALGIARAEGGPHPYLQEASIARAAAHISSELRGAFERNCADGWEWFEPEMTYDNARLPEALIRLGSAFGDRELVRIGLRSAAFLASVVTLDGIFVPIGNDGWYPRGGRRALYSQQPLEAAGMIDLALVAAEADRNPRWERLARTAFDWFNGANTLGIPLVRDGGCCDGLEEFGPNDNMGAESTLAYLSSAFALAGGAWRAQRP